MPYNYFAKQTAENVIEDKVRRLTVDGVEAKVYLDNYIVIVDGVDDSEVDEVHRHLRVLHLGQRRPQPSVFHEPFWWCVLRNLWNSSWNMATISALRGPRSRHRASTSSQVIGCLKSHCLDSASN